MIVEVIVSFVFGGTDGDGMSVWERGGATIHFLSGGTVMCLPISLPHAKLGMRYCRWTSFIGPFSAHLHVDESSR